MGDRGNIFVVEREGGGVYLYGHWSGYRMPLVAKAALAKRWRWSDGQYLARILFEELIDKHRGEETGFGISTRLCDNEHPIVVVDPETQRIGFAKEGSEPKTVASWSFEEFVGMDDEAIDDAYGKAHR